MYMCLVKAGCWPDAVAEAGAHPGGTCQLPGRPARQRNPDFLSPLCTSSGHDGDLHSSGHGSTDRHIWVKPQEAFSCLGENLGFLQPSLTLMMSDMLDMSKGRGTVKTQPGRHVAENIHVSTLLEKKLSPSHAWNPKLGRLKHHPGQELDRPWLCIAGTQPA